MLAFFKIFDEFFRCYSVGVQIYFKFRSFSYESIAANSCYYIDMVMALVND